MKPLHDVKAVQVWVSALLVAACGQEPVPELPPSLAMPDAMATTADAASPPHWPTMGFSLGDIASNVGPTPLAVWVDDPGGAAASKAITAIAGSVELLTYPEMEFTAIDVSVRNAPGPAEPAATVPKGQTADIVLPEPYPARASIVIEPRAQLEPRWYILVVPSVPGGVTVLGGSMVVGSGRAVRFRPDSDPVRRGVSLCAKGGEMRRVMVHFSEGLFVGPAGLPSLTVDTSTHSAPCPMAASAATSQDRLYFDCLMDATSAPVVRVAMGTGLGAAADPLREAGRLNLAAKSAATLVDRTANAEAFDFDDVESAGGCKFIQR